VESATGQTDPDPLWDEIARLLEEASAMGPEERRAYVRANSSSEWVRAEVMDLFAAEELDGSFLERGADMSLLRDPLLGQRAGDCLLLRTAGEGGMGTVYEGLRTLALGDGGTAEQRVAVKVWHAGAVRAQEAVREARLLARLNHPHIARLLDTGQLPDGRPFLVMEFVEGRPLLEGAAGLDLRAKLVLFRKVCDAVEAAHRALIVHRDLKPSNILLTATGEPKLIDFGIGRSMEESGQTMDRRLTPQYASPEQLRGEPLGTATDVYSLGVILGELVAGAPVELASVILKATAERAEERYGSAQALSDDLERFLKGEPVRAVEATLGYRARKFLGRHRWAVGAGMAALALIGVAFLGAYREKRIAEQRFNEVRGLARTLLYEIHDEVAKTPGSLASRQVIVGRALEYLDRLADGARGDEALQMDLAEGYARVGEVQGSTTIMAESFAQHRDAAGSLAKSVGIWEQLYAARPGDRQRRVALARAVDKLAQACAVSGQEDCQRARMAQAERLFGEDAAENPGDPRAQVRWLSARIDARPVRGGDPEAVRGVYREVARGFDELLRRWPEEKQVVSFAAYAFKRLGALEGKMGAHAEGLAQYEKALRLHEREGNRMGVSTCYVDMAWIEQERKNWGAALGAMDRALGLRAELAKGRGADQNFKIALLSVMGRKAWLLEAAGRLGEAEVVAGEALRGPGAELAGLGQDRRVGDLLIGLHRIRGTALAGRGDGAGARREFGEGMRLMDLLEKSGQKVDGELRAAVRRGMGL
jgi:tetratricopeptide (TPR) repeat protein/predicted Ser/Thr protein kinase